MLELKPGMFFKMGINPNKKAWKNRRRKQALDDMGSKDPVQAADAYLDYSDLRKREREEAMTNPIDDEFLDAVEKYSYVANRS